MTHTLSETVFLKNCYNYKFHITLSMDAKELDNINNEEANRSHVHSLMFRIMKWTGISAAIIVILVIAGILGLTLWLTPERLAGIISEECSEAMNAEVKVTDVDYTIWSSFPYLDITVKSVEVRSRTLDNVPDSIRKILPANADFLMSAENLRGGVNILKLAGDRVWLRDLKAKTLNINLLAVNDSLNNYDIIKEDGPSKVPELRLDGVAIENGGKIVYTSLESSTKAEVTLKGASLTPLDSKDNYSLRLSGNIMATSDGLTILKGFPFELGGNVRLGFKPLRVSTTDYRIRFGNIRGTITMDMEMGNDLKLNNFNYRLEDASVSDLLAMFPVLDEEMVKGLEADVSISCSARLTSAYDFSSPWLPSAEVDFNVPRGRVRYTLADGGNYSIDSISLSGRFVFDGHDASRSYVDIDGLRLSGMGCDVRARAYISELTTAPEIRVDLNAWGDLRVMSDNIRELKPYKLGGDADLSTTLGFRIDGSTVYGSVSGLTVSSKHLEITENGNKIRVDNMELQAADRLADKIDISTLRKGIPLELTAGIGKLRISNPSASLNLEANGVRIAGKMSRRLDGMVIREVDLSVAGDNMTVRGKVDELRVSDARLRLQGKHMSNIQAVRAFTIPASWLADARTQGFTQHTPSLLKVSIPAWAQQLMREWQMNVDLNIKKAGLVTHKLRGLHYVEDVDISANFDSVTMLNVTLRSGMTRGRLSGNIGNLRQFLTTAAPAPLQMNIAVKMDTVQINELARAYALANPTSSAALGDKSITGKENDSTVYLIPRNIEGKVLFTADETRYTNLHLDDIYGLMNLRDGRLVVDTLHIGSDFGYGLLKMSYDTSDMQNLNMRFNVGLLDVNVVGFFQNFHKVLLMMPEMSNLKGTISAQADGRVMIFPNNYVNVPSMWANVWVTGRDLSLHQSPFVRHVTKMLLMPDNPELHIADIDIHAVVQDNLLEVYPFMFAVDKYRLRLGGLNNFGGKLYYHIGVDESPMKLPFGINVKGTYRKPELRFGGKDWHDIHGSEIAAGVQDNISINIVKMARKYISEFVHKAATYTGD